MFAMIHGWFIYVCVDAFPFNMWNWATIGGCPFLLLSKAFRERAARHGQSLVTQAQEGVLAGLDKDQDNVVDEQSSASKEELELKAWVSTVLGAEDNRCALLAHELVVADLTRERMIAAARLPGGFQVLHDTLHAQRGALTLRPGERLALASAAMRESLSENGTAS